MATPLPVQGVSVQSSGTATSLTTPSFVSTANNLLVACWGDSTQATYGASPVGDSKTNTWAQAVARTFSAGSGCALGIRYAKNIVGGSGHTVTLTATAPDFLCLAVEEISGADTTAPLDQHPAGVAPNTLSSNPHNANALTPSQANTLAVSGMSHNGSNSNTFAATGTATVRTSQAGTANQPIALATDARSDVSSVTEGFNLTPNDSLNYVAVVANFIGAAAAAVQPWWFRPVV